MQGIILVSYIWWDLPLSPSMYSVIWEVPWAAEKNKYSLVNGEMVCQLCPFHLQRYLTLVFLFASCLENLSWQVWVIEISHYQCVWVNMWFKLKNYFFYELDCFFVWWIDDVQKYKCHLCEIFLWWINSFFGCLFWLVMVWTLFF